MTVAFTWRRMRGWLLRAVLRRSTAIALGTALALPAVWLWWGDYAWETWYTDGLALILGATGVALMLAGFGGRRPDWVEPGS
jgi:hypothetical protein